VRPERVDLRVAVKRKAGRAYANFGCSAHHGKGAAIFGNGLVISERKLNWAVIDELRKNTDAPAGEILHFNVKDRPTASWVIQQLREAFPFDTAAKYLVFDRDPAFSADVLTVLRAMGMKPTRTAFRSPWQNGVAERFVGTLRRELLDHTIVVNDRQLAHHRYSWRAAA